MSTPQKLVMVSRWVLMILCSSLFFYCIKEAIYLELLNVFLQDIYVVVVQHPFFLLLLHLQVFMLQLQQNRLVGLYHNLQPPYFLHQLTQLNLTDLPLTLRPLKHSRARHEYDLGVSLIRIASIVMLDMSFLAGAFGMPKLGDLGRFVIEAGVDFAELIRVWVVEVSEGVGMPCFFIEGFLVAFGAVEHAGQVFGVVVDLEHGIGDVLGLAIVLLAHWIQKYKERDLCKLSGGDHLGFGSRVSSFVVTWERRSFSQVSSQADLLAPVFSNAFTTSRKLSFSLGLSSWLSLRYQIRSMASNLWVAAFILIKHSLLYVVNVFLSFSTGVTLIQMTHKSLVLRW